MGNAKSGRRPAHEEMKLKKGQLSSRQVSEQAGVSMGMLDWWAKKGFLDYAHDQIGEGKGSRRVWTKMAPWGVKDLVNRLDACPYDHKTS